MSVNNIYDSVARLWSKNMILIVKNSIINDNNRKHFSTNFKSVRIKCFSRTAIDYIYFNLIPLPRIKAAPSILHMDTNNSPNETFLICNKVPNFDTFIKENALNCHFRLSSPIDRLMAKHLSLLRD